MTKLNYSRAFTIVELLVVIVVIGILAAITVVSYAGIKNKAIISSLQSDLYNASKQLKMFNIDNGYYPTSISTDCVSSPTTTTNLCLKISPGNSFTDPLYPYSNPTPQSFMLTEVNDNGQKYTISEDGAPKIYTASEYQEWDNFPDSPVLTNDYPYQVIVKHGVSNIVYLYVSTTGYTSFTTIGAGLSNGWRYVLGNPVPPFLDKVYKINNNAWELVSTAVHDLEIDARYGESYEFKESNCDIRNNGFEPFPVVFAKTTT